MNPLDVLYHLYDKLSIGGFAIIDDWFGFPARTACEDFFAVHEISPQIVPIDALSVYWRKESDVDIQYWRYVEAKFKLNQTRSGKEGTGFGTTSAHTNENDQ